MDMDISLQPAQTQLQNLSQFLIFVLKFQNTLFSLFSNELISELENFWQIMAYNYVYNSVQDNVWAV